MKALCLSALLCIIAPSMHAAGLNPLPEPQSLEQAVELWQSTERAVRDQIISHREARKRFVLAYACIRERCELPPPTARWTFPLLGYGPRNFSRHSYLPKGFNYYLGTKGGAVHPAVDIFVKDKRERSRDDRTGKPIIALAAFEGIVVSVQPAWKPGDRWRGGVYVYVMEPESGRIAYYAHLREPWVLLGQTVKPGDIIGEVGRTGSNAHKRRSRTHLHFMWMKVNSKGDFRCLNPCKPLNAARTVSYLAFDKIHPGFLKDPRWGQ